jgi:hypothetical protein
MNGIPFILSTTTFPTIKSARQTASTLLLSTEEWHRQGLLDERGSDDTTQGASVSRFKTQFQLAKAGPDLLEMWERKVAGSLDGSAA